METGCEFVLADNIWGVCAVLSLLVYFYPSTCILIWPPIYIHTFAKFGLQFQTGCVYCHHNGISLIYCLHYRLNKVLWSMSYVFAYRTFSSPCALIWKISGLNGLQQEILCDDTEIYLRRGVITALPNDCKHMENVICYRSRAPSLPLICVKNINAWLVIYYEIEDYQRNWSNLKIQCLFCGVSNKVLKK